MLQEKLLNTIKNQALLSLPEECCGLILRINKETIVRGFSPKTDNILLWPTENFSEHDKKISFKIPPHEIIKAEQHGEVIGIYHSHNTKSKNNIFSELDLTNVKIHQLLSVVYNLCENQFYFLNDIKQLKYLGRKFKIGKSDCFALIRDYFKNELKITIKDYKRDSRWFKTNPNMWLDNYKDAGGVIVCEGEKCNKFDFKQYDVLVTDGAVNNLPCHGAIYLDNKVILHHPRNRLSTIEPLTNLKNKVLFVLRHKSML